MTSSDSSEDSPIETNIITKKVTRKEIEIWDVIQLDSKLEPVSKPSDVFDKLQEKRKTLHENILNQLKQDLHKVNIQTEKNIKISSTEVKAHMKFFNDQLDEILKSIDIPEVESYDGSVFLKFQNQASSYKSQQQKLVDELYEDLNKFENERAEENEKLLKKACEEIQKIRYFSPYEGQAFVENEAMKMNQLSLNNRRCYADLRLTLTLITEQMFKSFMDKVFCIREKWSNCRTEEPCVEEEKEEVPFPKPTPEPYSRLELKGRELPIVPTPDNLYNSCEPNIWFKNVQDVTGSIESFTKNLIEIYRKTLDAIFCGFDSGVDAVRNEITSFQSVIIQERTIKPLCFKESTKEIENLETFWQDNFTCMRSLLEDGAEFLKDIGGLWDRHVDRLCESKKLILKALEKANDSNHSSLQDLDVKLNMGLDALRQEFVLSKLEKAYEAVVGVLNAIKVKLEGLYHSDVSIIQEYIAMVELEADVLSAELQEFINAIHYVDVTKTPHRSSDPYRCFPEEKPIVKMVYACMQQIKAISYWKQGVWIALEGFSQKTKETFLSRGERWVRKKVEALSDKKAVEFELYNKRFERLVGFYETRKREVELHNSNFEKHKEGIKIAFVRMNEKLKTVTNRQMNELEEMKKYLEEVENKLKKETRAGVICSTRIRLERRKEDLEKKLKHSYGRFLADCESEMLDLKSSNISYIKNIKLFHEGGRYSTEEGKSIAGLIETLDKDITNQFKNISETTTNDQNDVLMKCPLMFAPTLNLLSSLYEETQFFQKVQERMTDFLKNLGELSESLKSDFELLQQQTDCLVKVVQNSEPPLNESHYKFWMILLQNLYKNVSNLLYPIDLIQTPVSSSRCEPQDENSGEADTCLYLGTTRYSIQATASKTPTFRTAEVEDNLVCTDYKQELFGREDPPENDGTFMAIVSNGLWAEMDALQKLACSFYRKIQKEKVVREDLIPGNYEAFVDELLLKFRFYNVQCEQLWLKTLLDFLPVLGRIKQTTNLYIDRTLEDYQNTTLETLKLYKEDFLACLESQTLEAKTQFKILENKLLALHGSPKNKDLLSQLEEEVVQRTANLSIGWEAAVSKFRNSIRCFRLRKLQDKEDIERIQIQNIKMREKLFTEDLGTNLLKSIIEYAERGGFWTRRNPQNSLIDEVPDEYKLDQSESLLNVQSYFEILRNIIDGELSGGDAGYFPEADWEESLKPCQPKLNVLLQPFDSESFVLDILGKLEECLKEMKLLAKSKENVQEEALFKWLEIWKFNVKKVEALYRVKYEERPLEEKRVSDVQNDSRSKSRQIDILYESSKKRKKRMAEVDDNKPESEKTSASVSATLQRLCPTTELQFKDITCNIPRLKSWSQRSKSSEFPNDSIHPGIVIHPKTNLYKSKLSELRNSGQVRFTCNVSLTSISPRNYRGQIPTYRHSLKSLRMSHPITRSPSPTKKINPKDAKTSSKVKTINLERLGKKSPSPTRRTPGTYKKTKLGTSPPKVPEKPAISKRSDTSKQITSPRAISPTKRKSKGKLISKEKLEKGLQKSSGDADAAVLKQTSQPSLCKAEKLISPQEKISLDHIKNELCSRDHKRLSYEKVQLCIEKSLENLSLGERKQSYLVTYSSKDLQKQEEISLYLQNLSSTSITTYSTDNDRKRLSEEISETKAAIRTLSGHELILTPSMKLDMDKAECESLEISKLLHETGENFEEQKEVHLFQDDANEYDSEVSTDGDVAGRETRKQTSNARVSRADLQRKSASSLWRKREADMLNDVDYRQSVYHPAVSRWQSDEQEATSFKPKSKSIEDNFGFANQGSERVVRSRSTNLRNKYPSQGMGKDNKDDSCNDRSWGLDFDKIDGKPMYNSVLQDAPLYSSLRGSKRVRTKKERVSGALLRFTLKIIRLLAIFNIWPGDNCYMLTSQSLRFAR